MTAGRFNLPGWSDSNSATRQENNPVTGVTLHSTCRLNRACMVVTAFNGSVSLPVAGYNYNSGWISFCWRDLHPLEWQLASLHGQLPSCQPLLDWCKAAQPPAIFSAFRVMAPSLRRIGCTATKHWRE
jgi:hypothetical protein